MPEFKLSDEELDCLADRLADRLVDRLTDRLAKLTAKPDNQSTKLLYTEKEAAKQLGLSLHTLKKKRLRGEVKAFSAEKPVRYTWQNILDALGTRKHEGNGKP